MFVHISARWEESLRGRERTHLLPSLLPLCSLRFPFSLHISITCSLPSRSCENATLKVFFSDRISKFISLLTPEAGRLSSLLSFVVALLSKPSPLTNPLSLPFPSRFQQTALFAFSRSIHSGSGLEFPSFSTFSFRREQGTRSSFLPLSFGRTYLSRTSPAPPSRFSLVFSTRSHSLEAMLIRLSSLPSRLSFLLPCHLPLSRPCLSDPYSALDV